jgi:hypothetical protein
MCVHHIFLGCVANKNSTLQKARVLDISLHLIASQNVAGK